MAYRDTFKYRFLSQDGVELHCGITYDLDRRESEHQRHFDERWGRVKQVGRRTTREAAERWERRQGCSPYGRRADEDWGVGDVVGAAVTVGALALGVKLLSDWLGGRST